MRVQKLELVAMPGSADKDPRQQPPLIAAAACECAAVLLRSDATTELVVHGALASTETMSRACAGSSWCRSSSAIPRTPNRHSAHRKCRATKPWWKAWRCVPPSGASRSATRYYFLLNQRRIHGFEEAHAAARGNKGISPDKFRLKCAQYASNQEKQEAQSAFNAIGEQAQTVVTAPQVMLDQTQRQASMHEAFLELRRVVSQLLATQTGSLDAKGIEDVAGRVANHLAHSQALSSIVHLSQVSTAMDHRKLRDPTAPDKNKTPDVVKQLVRLDNKARREPRSVNTVDAHGANNKLLEATRKNKVADLRELLRQGAIDFRAQA